MATWANLGILNYCHVLTAKYRLVLAHLVGSEEHKKDDSSLEFALEFHLLRPSRLRLLGLHPNLDFQGPIVVYRLTAE